VPHLKRDMKLTPRFAVLVIATATLIFMIAHVIRVNLNKKEVKVQVQRQLLVRDGCNSYSNETREAEMEQHFGIKNYPGGLLDNIFVIDKYKMLYCVVPKVIIAFFQNDFNH
jgi:hypothetical protein